MRRRIRVVLPADLRLCGHPCGVHPGEVCTFIVSRGKNKTYPSHPKSWGLKDGGHKHPYEIVKVCGW